MDERPCPQCSAQVEVSHQFCPFCGFPVGKVTKEGGDKLIGRTLPGGFSILELVGVGGMGRVYRAEQKNLGRTVAVKIIHPHLVGEENAAARFITEARASSSLNHPNSISVFDFGKAETGELYLVMEFLRGKDLARIMYEEGPLTFSRITKILVQVLAALAEAHHLGIIHRDLKPENIILEKVRQGSGDFVKVVDFGLAKMREVQPGKKGITQQGIVCGTPEYMSPEQGRGDVIDARSDLYAVGVILYQLLTGYLPFEADSPTQVVLMHITQIPIDPRVMAPERQIPDSVADVCLMALAKDASHRFNNADEFAEALSDAVAVAEDAARSVRIEALQIVCAKCSARNTAGQKFCGECGSPIGHANFPTPSPLTAVSPAVMRPSYAVRASHMFPLPLTGRHNELTFLGDITSGASTSLKAGRILGESGSGKTRLLSEFLRSRAEVGDIVALTGPDPFFASVGYFTVCDAIVKLTSLPASGGERSAWIGASTEAQRGLAELFGSESQTPAALPTTALLDRRFDMAEALRWALTRALQVAGKAQVVLAIDDFQGVDSASRRVFFDVLSSSRLARTTLLFCHPPDFEADWPSALPSCTLSALSERDTSSILIHAGVLTPLPDARARGALPLYLEQFIRYVGEQGVNPPPGVADLIAARLERLVPDARRVLQAISVYGNGATIATIKGMVPSNTQVEDGLTVLNRAAMIVAQDGRLAVSHPLLREIALASIPNAVRQSLHSAAAEVGEAEGVPLEALAGHEFAAQNAFQALVLLEQVATKRNRRGDTEGAALALRHGLELARLELFRGRIDEPERAVLLFSRKLGEALFKMRRLTDADGVLREAIDIPGAPGAERARALAVLAQVASARDKKPDANRYLQEAKKLAERAGAHDVLFIVEGLERSVAP